ncbi:MAG TPA: hypothetical protein VFK04_12910 [Gemmatimonadaceae bacterium]|nr:hypothetical protein [Gemmatimonadaceae bacterium]
MSEKIKPALTREDWARRGTIRADLVIALTDEGVVAIDDGETQSVHLPSSAFHAVAAFTLHGQPFGFTREDVDSLRLIGRILHEPRTPFTRDDLLRAESLLESITDRIAALLPPEEG